MRTFTILWWGQIISTLGSYMTQFAIKLLLWDRTEQATTLTTMILLSVVSGLLVASVAGTLVDRWNRKFLLMASDCLAVLITLTLSLLYWKGHLQVWHFYLAEAIQGGLGELQNLAYSSVTVALVPQQHYARASSMNTAIHYSSIIFAPAIAGLIYPLIGFGGISLIDMCTFGLSMLMLWMLNIPQPLSPDPDPNRSKSHGLSKSNLQGLKDFWTGFQYILSNPGLLTLLLFAIGFEFAHEVGSALYTPMILARSHNHATALGSINAAAGLGGVVGALVLLIWPGPQQRMKGYLAAMLGIGLSKMGFGWGTSLPLWMGTQFLSSLHFPLLGSSETAIWWSKTATHLHGRVLAARSICFQIASMLAIALAGPLADHYFEPALQPAGVLAPSLGKIFGTSAGSGIAVIYTFSSFLLLGLGLVGSFVPSIHRLESRNSNVSHLPQ